ncbi:MAG: zinc ABC transporter substrate-binding protein [Planctomycetaceae bacterium]|jgi:zinc transport system substrate-binding protein|nr:zinc ABC transporter substrate-binding protein [Planctomycetaceae bacterium]
MIRLNNPAISSVFSLYFTVLLFFIFCILSGCLGQQGKKLPDNRLKIAVSVEPHAFLLERIGGERLRIEVLVPTGKEPEHYQATPDKIAVLSQTKVLFRTGMPFENVLIPKLKAINSNLKIVDLRKGIALRPLELHDHQPETELHEHDNHDSVTKHHNHNHHSATIDSSHHEFDPHIWFAPTILKTEVQTILQTLLEIDPEGAVQYRNNAEQFLEEIEVLRIDLAKRLAPLKGKTVFVFHPSYGYFCDELGLRQRAIEFEGKSPKPKQLTALITEIRNGKNIPVIFVQPEFNQAPSQAITETTGAKIVIHSSLERNVLQSMKRFAEEIILNENSIE